MDDCWLLLERECIVFRDVGSERLPMLLEEMVLHPYTYWQHKGDSVGLRKSSWRTREGTGEDRLIKKIHYMHIYIYQTRKHFL